MKPNKSITYPDNNKEDIFTKIIRFIKSLELFTKKNHKALNYLLGGLTMIALGLIIWINA